ncbi:MAG: hypothetical protein ABSB88_01640 [Bryobacteraceae bacterium]|jgi:hypothetical protein
MDLRQYYQKIREKEAAFKDPFPVLVSRETGDGGKNGVLTEVTPQIAARMVIDGTAQEASEEQAREFRKQQAEVRRMAQEAAEAAKVLVAVVTTDEFKRIKGGKPGKE